MINKATRVQKFHRTVVIELVIAHINGRKGHLFQNGRQMFWRDIGETRSIDKVTIHDKKDILVGRRLLEFLIKGQDVAVIGIERGFVPTVTRHPTVHIRHGDDVDVAQGQLDGCCRQRCCLGHEILGQQNGWMYV